MLFCLYILVQKKATELKSISFSSCKISNGTMFYRNVDMCLSTAILSRAEIFHVSIKLYTLTQHFKAQSVLTKSVLLR